MASMYFICRLLYKSIQYGCIVLRSKLSTLFFRCLLTINQVEYKKGVKTKVSIPDLVINRKAQQVRIGNNVVFNNYGDHSWYCKCKLFVRKDAVLTIGDNTGFNGILIYAAKEIRIGNNVKVGGGTRISDTNFHSLDYEERRSACTDGANAACASVIIEDDVFIGANCIIGKGVVIGARSLVAAGSVVVKSIPADCIAGGNPAKVIRQIGK